MQDSLSDNDNQVYLTISMEDLSMVAARQDI